MMSEARKMSTAPIPIIYVKTLWSNVGVNKFVAVGVSVATNNTAMTVN